MPLLTTGQRHSWTKQPPYSFYNFPEMHKANWKTFWEEMDGDREKILAFAEKADIECPCEWFESLHRFLFDSFSGDVKLMKKASKEGFGAFLAKIAENHINDPKDKYWYFDKGITQGEFLHVLESASEIDDPRQAVSYINARVRDFGFDLYSEYILSKTKEKKELTSIASEMYKKAYELENAVAGRDLISVKAGDKIKHNLFADLDLTVDEVSVDEEKKLVDIVIAKDASNHTYYIEDVWNIERA
jgi:hypothetical protein